MSVAASSAGPTWPLVLLGEICDVNIGRTPARERREFWGPGYPWLSIADMNQGRDLETTAETITDVAVRECKCRLVPAGTVLLSFKLSIGKVGIARRPLYTNEAIAALPIKDSSRLLPDFLYWALRTIDLTLGLDRAAKGLTLNKDKLVRVQVPLPPVPEQQRIAEILEKADALRAKRRASITELDTLTQSIFLDMFGDPATNPKGWPQVTIADICEVKGGKRLPKGEEYSATPTPFRYLRVIDLRDGRVDESELVYLKPEIQAQIARYVVNVGDVIISIAGSIGLVAPVPASLDGVNLTENAAKLVPRRGNVYEAAYLSAFLQTRHAQSQIGSHIGQVTIGKLALFRIEKIKVPMPPNDLQRGFIRCITAAEAHAAMQHKAQAQLNALFASLQNRAFQGEL